MSPANGGAGSHSWDNLTLAVWYLSTRLGSKPIWLPFEGGAEKANACVALHPMATRCPAGDVYIAERGIP